LQAEAMTMASIAYKTRLVWCALFMALHTIGMTMLMIITSIACIGTGAFANTSSIDSID
jgi:hypothetical protein